MADYMSNSLATGGRFTLTPSLGVIPASIAINDIRTDRRMDRKGLASTALCIIQHSALQAMRTRCKTKG